MKANRLYLFVGITLLAMTATYANDASATYYSGGKDYIGVPDVEWAPCFKDFGPFECATYVVPLDHSSASKYFYLANHQPGIELALIRLKATDPDSKIGSLFVNPGGPGGSGVSFVLNLGPFLYSSEVRARFDIFGFDPRGTNRSTALSCFTSFELVDRFFELPSYPDDAQTTIDQIFFDRDFRAACRENAGPIIDNMSTADVARDMDILREAVRDDQLTYAGYSYGSFLGVTYANLFPDRVRALIVDGVLDPIQWTTGDRRTRRLPVSTRLRSDAGAQATLEEFFRLCDLAGDGRCAVAGDAGLRYDALLARVEDEPIILSDSDGSEFVVDNVSLTAVTLDVLYNPFDWGPFSQDLALLESLSAQTAPATEFNVIGKTPQFEDAPELIPQTIEALPGVLCSDSNNPRLAFAWRLAAVVAERRFGNFGGIWTWLSSACARWPGSKSSRYAGPFTRHTANPVLVTGPTFDPATRFEGAETVAKLLPNSQLLTVQGWGHTTLFLSQCADEIASDYLVNVNLPSSSEVCAVDFPPFNLSLGEVYPNGAAIATQRSDLQIPVPGEEISPRDGAADHRARAIRIIRGNRPSYSP